MEGECNGGWMNGYGIASAFSEKQGIGSEEWKQDRIGRERV